MANLKDVAREAGVSLASASYALNGGKPVSDDLRARVLRAVERTGYVPHRQAQTLRTGRSRTLGVVLPDLGNPFFPSLLKAIEASARAAGYGLLVADAGGGGMAEREALARLREHRVDGLIWAPAGDPHEVPDVPTVTVDRRAEGCDAVVSDHRQAGRLLAEHLDRAGRRRPAVLHGPPEIPSARARAEGFAERWTGEVAYEATVCFDHDLPSAVRTNLSGPDRTFDAVVCANDAVAIGVFRLLRQRGLAVPRDVAVVAVDDIPWARLVEPALTTVRQPVGALGREAVALLLDRLTNPHRPARRRTLPVRLVVRASSPEPAPSGEQVSQIAEAEA